MIAGPFESHTLNGRRFTCDADDDAKWKFGGKNNEVKPNGDGSSRVVQSRKTDSIEGGSLVIDFDKGDDEFLQDLKNSGKMFDYSGTANDGAVFAGLVQIVDAIEISFKAGTASVSLQGKIEKQGV